jgi:TPR repeat protein
MNIDTDAAEAAAAKDIEERRYEDAFRKYSVLAEHGSATAQLRLGWMYETGTGVPLDVQLAERWYLKAASTDVPHAQYYLASLYRDAEQYQRAIEWFQRAAAQGYPPAFYALGKAYYFGAGVSQDREKAFEYFEEASRRGHLRAAANIARDMIAGRRGLRQVPLGVLRLLTVLSKGLRRAITEPDSDSLKA